jgi:predicted nucleic acid-binding protein
LTRCLLDVNVILDMVLDRRPHLEAARALWAAAERKEIEAVVSAHGVTTVFYVVARERGAAFARRIITDLVVVPSIAAVDGPILRRALDLGWPDFEDAVCAAAAEAASCDLLVTRDAGGFKDSPVPVVDPVTALSLVRGETGPDRVGERPRRAYRSQKASGRAKRRP